MVGSSGRILLVTPISYRLRPPTEQKKGRITGLASLVEMHAHVCAPHRNGISRAWDRLTRDVSSTTNGTLHTVGSNSKKSCPQSAVWLGDDKIIGFAGREVGEDMIYCQSIRRAGWMVLKSWAGMAHGRSFWAALLPTSSVPPNCSTNNAHTRRPTAAR